MHLINLAILSFLSGIAGTGLGGMSAFLFKNISKRTLSFILEFSGGLMVSVVYFEILPEAFDAGGTLNVTLGFFAGILIMLILDNMIKNLDSFQSSKYNKGLIKTGIIILIGLSLHNLPEGFAVGAGFQASNDLGFKLLAVILLHDIPEGIAAAIPIKAGGAKASTAFILTIMTGIPMMIGTIAGSYLGMVSLMFVPISLGFAGGAMVYVVFCELIPESKKIYAGRFSALGSISGICCGIMSSIIS